MMKQLTILSFLFVLQNSIAQDYDYLQNGIEPRFTDKWEYAGKSTPSGRKHDSSLVNSAEVHLFPGDSIINQKDENGLKQGHWIIYGKDRPDSGVPADGKVEEGYYIDDKKEGTWVKYQHDGITPKLKGEYKNNRPTGSYTRSRGDIREIGTFEKNQYHDSLIRGSRSIGGNRTYEAFYNENGKEEGRVNYYYPNGHPEYTYIAKNGIPTGQATRYYKNGAIKELIEFAEDGSVVKTESFELVTSNASETISTEKAPLPVHPINTKGIKWNPDGYNKVYNEDDEVWQDGIFKEGKLWEGKVYVYDRDGILLRVKVFKDGVYHSDGQL